MNIPKAVSPLEEKNLERGKAHSAKCLICILTLGFPCGSVGKESSCSRQCKNLGQEDHLEKVMATHSTIFAWKIPWSEEPGGLQSMGSQRAGHD